MRLWVICPLGCGVRYRETFNFALERFKIKQTIKSKSLPKLSWKVFFKLFTSHVMFLGVPGSLAKEGRGIIIIKQAFNFKFL